MCMYIYLHALSIILFIPQDPVGLEPGDTSSEVIVTAKTHCHVLALNKNELNELMTNLSSESKCTCTCNN